MNEQQIRRALEDFWREVESRYERVQIESGAAEEVVGGDRYSVVWIKGDKSRCCAAVRTRYVNGVYAIMDRIILDEPQEPHHLPLFCALAFKCVTENRSIAIQAHLVVTRKPNDLDQFSRS